MNGEPTDVKATVIPSRCVVPALATRAADVELKTKIQGSVKKKIRHGGTSWSDGGSANYGGEQLERDGFFTDFVMWFETVGNLNDAPFTMRNIRRTCGKLQRVLNFINAGADPARALLRLHKEEPEFGDLRLRMAPVRDLGQIEIVQFDLSLSEVRSSLAGAVQKCLQTAYADPSDHIVEAEYYGFFVPPTPIEKREVFDVVYKFAMINEVCTCEAVAESLEMPLARVRDVVAVLVRDGGYCSRLIKRDDDCFTVREGATRPPLEMDRFPDADDATVATEMDAEAVAESSARERPAPWASELHQDEEDYATSVAVEDSKKKRIDAASKPSDSGAPKRNLDTVSPEPPTREKIEAVGKPSPTTELGKRREFADPKNPFDDLRESDDEDEEEDGDALMPPPLPPMRRVGIPRPRK